MRLNHTNRFVPIVEHVFIISLLLGLSLVSLPIQAHAAEATAPQIADVSAPKPLWPDASNTSHSNVQLSVLLDEKHHEASLYNGDKEMILLHSTDAKANIQKRILTLRDRLQTYFDNGGTAREITPAQVGSQVVIRAGKSVLMTVDATIAGTSEARKDKALQWTNELRTALGADALTHTAERVASRGFSPSLAHLRSDLQNFLPTGMVQKGVASWYGPGFHGHRAANGERFDMNALTAAHRTLPLNSYVRVTNPRTGKSAVVKITDRGPYARGRIIDLSKGAAKAVGVLSSGTAPVVLEVLR